MNIERLKRLITIISSIPAERFDMENWRKPDRDGSGCGTAACAAGWACMDPGFNQEGLVHKGEEMHFSPAYKQWEHYDAVAAFFGLSIYWTQYIFNPEKYDKQPWEIEPADVIIRIDQVIHGITP